MGGCKGVCHEWVIPPGKGGIWPLSIDMDVDRLGRLFMIFAAQGLPSSMMSYTEP